MRPYLEVKVVKVKKEKEIYSSLTEIKIDGRKFRLYKDKKGNLYPHELKGNWANGENLDKIKFPCFCRFTYGEKRCYGEVNKAYDCGRDVDIYEISDISRQINGESGQMFSVIYTSDSLIELIEVHEVHILKGKIILFEEE